MDNQIEKMETLKLEARNSGDTRRAERLKDDIERLKRITAGIDVQFQHKETKRLEHKRSKLRAKAIISYAPQGSALFPWFEMLSHQDRLIDIKML